MAEETFKRHLVNDHIKAFEQALREGAEFVGLRNTEMIWTKNELRCVYKGVLVSGLDFTLNPITGSITAEMKPPQDLSAIIKVQ